MKTMRGKLDDCGDGMSKGVGSDGEKREDRRRGVYKGGKKRK